MVPNLDLLALACLYGSFIALILLLVIFFLLIVLFLSSSLALFSVFVSDLYDAYSVMSLYYEDVKAEIELGLSLIMFGVMGFGVDVVLRTKSLLRQQNLILKNIRQQQMKVKEKWRFEFGMLEEL
ncbi:hypothetical protein E5676_scaffold455G005000 [Cucumis melo var. makuwa]|uniref:Uncharacterized protein n=1 Tax=Cucumis melo var. makuwa TaxID=1194695 RepID=A0A5A7TB69_CUCMM|nr:hypothetical protein E6C27_scaffold92G001450 [Cucumis melo var. makuwa]TYK31214.1 hypothetical protein E5676_scaffold455G005000 [Cucumis melo var. makuwa]